MLTIPAIWLSSDNETAGVVILAFVDTHRGTQAVILTENKHFILVPLTDLIGQ